ncbi:hypothetical protein [Flagellimonas allohymeniacidonis]|uniref:Uncharacterized protein n=1 Tax=Flagellimonas allohymeniacidonis TaxID=2517819 RepID=A0A4Q8QI28_9FLAO|nr:hypothetical protein [Allomuricauda hymeniacidonis]TAI47836.1 hypothetical protein EW142_14370 [Allomuricauda hymeniacidonis]
MKSRSEHNFFTGTGIWYLITVFWGFAPSFYLSKYFENPDPLPNHLVIHGIVFTIWTLLYAVQVFLIRNKNFRVHQVFGIFGLCILMLMIPTGIFPSIYKVYAGTTTIDSAGHNVFRLSSGYILFALAFIYRKKAFLHKRFMLGGMVMLMSAAVFRISFDLNLQDSQLFNKGLQVLPAITLFILDLVRYKKVVLVDLISVVAVFGIFFFADYFWLSNFGEAFMSLLISIFVTPFL